MIPLHDNPAWLARAVTAKMDALRAAVPAEWLPELAKLRPTGRGNKVSAEIAQLGCGVYGCVMPTSDPKVVLKVTSDDTEVDFVRQILPKVAPVGITTYYATLDLGRALVAHKQRPVFGLWREAADGIGAVSADAAQLLRQAHDISDVIYTILFQDPDAHTLYQQAKNRPRSGPAADLAENFTDLVNAWKLVAADDELHHVGDALLSFLAAGVLVADVHDGNVGHVEREGADLVVITDPGHAAVLPSPWP